MKLSRRHLLATSVGLSATFAGCSGGNDSRGGRGSNTDPQNNEPVDTDGDGVPDAQDEYPDDPDLSSSQTESDTRNLEEDQWRHFSISFSSTGYIEFDFIVRDGPAIDVILMDESEYEHFDQGDRYEYIPDLSALDSSGTTVSSKVPEGEYRLVVDNSERGEASPPTNFSNDVVNVEYDLTLAE